MERLLITGGARLEGEVSVSGAKNAVVGILPAALLANDVSVIEKVPYISDVLILINIMRDMGIKVDFDRKGKVVIDPTSINCCEATCDMVNELRASYYLMGVLLGKYGKVRISYPGGCEIGERPVDQHIKGFESLGAKVTMKHGVITAEADRLYGSEIYLDVVSVGATINIMLAAVLAEGTTTIVNAAKEPHVVDIANFLNCMGANVKGAGTDIIRINGVESLHGCTYMVIPDQIEAGTFMIAAAATKGDVVIKDIIPKHLESISAKLMEMGVKVREYGDAVRVTSDSRPKSVTVKTLPYPGFPTDLQQPISVLLSVAEGTSLVVESVWEARYKHIEEIKKMGAKVKIEDRVAVIEGIERLSAAPVIATDLRAGAALVIAGLIAEGETKIGNLKYIDRGYENFENKLIELGAQMRRIKAD